MRSQFTHDNEAKWAYVYINSSGAAAAHVPFLFFDSACCEFRGINVYKQETGTNESI